MYGGVQSKYVENISVNMKTELVESNTYFVIYEGSHTYYSQ